MREPRLPELPLRIRSCIREVFSLAGVANGRSAPCLKLPLERDSERQLAIATGLAIRDSSDTPAGFIYIVLFKTIFRDKPH